MISAFPKDEAVDDKEEDDADNQEGSLSGTFFQNTTVPLTFGSTLDRLARQLKNPEISAEHLEKIMDRLLRINQNGNLPDYLHEKVTDLLSTTYEKAELFDDPYLLEELKRKLKKSGFSVSESPKSKNIPRHDTAVLAA